MVRRLVVVAITAGLLTACSTYHDTSRQRLETMSQHYSQFDLVMAWETRVSGGKTVVEGAVRNVRYAYMYDLEIWVAVLDAKGKVVSRSVSYVLPRQLNLDQSAEFTLKLPVAVYPGTRLRFTYKYRPSEGGEGPRPAPGMEAGTPWMQSFEAVVPAR